MLKEISVKDEKKLREWLDERCQEIDPDVIAKASVILKRVREEKDEAVRAYTEQFDHVRVDTFRVSEKELDEAEALCSEEFKDAMRKAVSMGGDSDTLACITGGIAEAYYKVIPENIATPVWNNLPESLREIVKEVSEKTPYGSVFSI